MGSVALYCCLMFLALKCLVPKGVAALRETTQSKEQTEMTFIPGKEESCEASHKPRGTLCVYVCSKDPLCSFEGCRFAVAIEVPGLAPPLSFHVKGFLMPTHNGTAKMLFRGPTGLKGCTSLKSSRERKLVWTDYCGPCLSNRTFWVSWGLRCLKVTEIFFFLSKDIL